MSSINLVVPAEYKCTKCDKPAVTVKTDVKGTPNYARCEDHKEE